MEPDADRLRATVEHLEAIERAPTSPGEHAAATWIRDRLAPLVREVRIEPEPAHGSFPVPLALLCAAGAAAGLARRGRVLPALAGVAAAAGIVDEVSGGTHLFRRLLPRRTTWNVVAEAGDPDGAETLVFCAHHDAARAGLVFHPGPTELVARLFPRWYDRQETSPPLLRLVVAGPALAGLGALLGRRRVRVLGGLTALVSGVLIGEIEGRGVVPGANDNLAAVAVLLELARALDAEPVAGVRVLLVSTGAEESFMEGMRGFVARHGRALERDRTRFVVLECLGGEEPIVLEGEGMVRMRDYTPAMRDWLAACGEAAGVRLRRRLRSGFATDALITLKAGYPTGVLASVDGLKMAANYHRHHDLAEHVDWGTVTGLSSVCLAAIRSLARPPAAPPPA
jgi:hypothetical protein